MTLRVSWDKHWNNTIRPSAMALLGSAAMYYASPQSAIQGKKDESGYSNSDVAWLVGKTIVGTAIVAGTIIKKNGILYILPEPLKSTAKYLGEKVSNNVPALLISAGGGYLINGAPGMISAGIPWAIYNIGQMSGEHKTGKAGDRTEIHALGLQIAELTTQLAQKERELASFRERVHTPAHEEFLKAGEENAISADQIVIKEREIAALKQALVQCQQLIHSQDAQIAQQQRLLRVNNIIK